jgi:hypothetical protein
LKIFHSEEDFSTVEAEVLEVLTGIMCAYPAVADVGSLMSSTFTSETLRAIGNDLDLRGIKTFSLRRETDLFIVDGGYQAPPASTPVTVHYCRKDIEELSRKAAESSDYLFRSRTFIYRSEILSAIGTYVEDKPGNLVSISNLGSTETAPVIEIAYDTDSEQVIERLTDADVYALCIRGHKRRQRREASSDIRFTRFSSLGRE